MRASGVFLSFLCRIRGILVCSDMSGESMLDDMELIEARGTAHVHEGE